MAHDDSIEFWRLPKVLSTVGLSRSEVYRRIASGKFPAPRRYPESGKSFWLSSDVRKWQSEALGIL